jgi:hypothetical protein
MSKPDAGTTLIAELLTAPTGAAPVVRWEAKLNAERTIAPPGAMRQKDSLGRLATQ